MAALSGVAASGFAQPVLLAGWGAGVLAMAALLLSAMLRLRRARQRWQHAELHGTRVRVSARTGPAAAVSEDQPIATGVTLPLEFIPPRPADADLPLISTEARAPAAPPALATAAELQRRIADVQRQVAETQRWHAEAQRRYMEMAFRTEEMRTRGEEYTRRTREALSRFGLEEALGDPAVYVWFVADAAGHVLRAGTERMPAAGASWSSTDVQRQIRSRFPRLDVEHTHLYAGLRLEPDGPRVNVAWITTAHPDSLPTASPIR